MRKLIVASALAVVTIGAGGTAFAGEGTGSGHGGPNGDGRSQGGSGLPDLHRRRPRYGLQRAPLAAQVT